MPRFIGNRISGALQIDDNANASPGIVQLSYTQARLLRPDQIMCSLNTSDKGGRRRMAKRWFNWFARIEDVCACEHATTTTMLRRVAMKTRTKTQDGRTHMLGARACLGNGHIEPCNDEVNCMACIAAECR
jgi:hypothetical protein